MGNGPFSNLLTQFDELFSPLFASFFLAEAERAAEPEVDFRLLLLEGVKGLEIGLESPEMGEFFISGSSLDLARMAARAEEEV